MEEESKEMKVPETKIDLSLLPIEVLLREIERRFDVSIFCGKRIQDVKTGERFYYFHYRGDPDSCVGLSSILSVKLVQDLSLRKESGPNLT